MDGDTANIIDIEERAKKLSELTGREYEDVLTDLLDDGKLNQSNTEDSADLVEQLKDAAELIATVQNISKDIQENTVLNGGDNETKVEVTTTLEGDVVDRAIESVHRKVQNIKKIALIILPVFLLLTGGTLEGMGFINVLGGEETNNEYGACLNPDATNYDSFASWDDGSCYWSGEPICDANWIYDDYSTSNENEIYVKFLFFDSNECDVELQGHFIIMLFKDGSSQGIPLHSEDTGIFRNNIEIYSDFIDLEEGTYDYEIEFHTIECDDGTCEHGAEFTSPHKPTFEVQDTDCISNTELDAPLLIANGNELSVELVFSDLNNCGQDIEIYMDIWSGGQLHDTLDYGEVHSGVIWIEPNGDTTIRVEGRAELANIPDGDEWTVKARYRHTNDNSDFESDWIQSNSIVIDEVQDPIYGCTDSNATNYDSNATENDNSCEYPPEICEINLFDYGFTTNSTHASVYFDLDCGYETNNLSGYNVTVQFLVYELNGTNSGPNATGPIIYEFCIHYIEGWVADINYLTLTNFTSSNSTHYDFYWYAMWTDGNGEGQIIEQKWLNRELNP